MSKLERAVRQTVNRWEAKIDKGYEPCGFCEEYKLCRNCPVENTDTERLGYPEHRDDCNYITRHLPLSFSEEHTPYCLAVMVYTWGFLNVTIGGR